MQIGKWSANEELLLQAIHPSLQRCWEGLNLSILRAKRPYGHRIYGRQCWSPQALPCDAISPTCQRIVSKSFSWLHMSRKYGGDWRSNLKQCFSILFPVTGGQAIQVWCAKMYALMCEVRDAHNGLIRTPHLYYSYTCIRKHPQRLTSTLYHYMYM